MRLSEEETDHIWRIIGIFDSHGAIHYKLQDCRNPDSSYAHHNYWIQCHKKWEVRLCDWGINQSILCEGEPLTDEDKDKIICKCIDLVHVPDNVLYLWAIRYDPCDADTKKRLKIWNKKTREEKKKLAKLGSII